jgi:hypothetical protein
MADRLTFLFTVPSSDYKALRQHVKERSAGASALARAIKDGEGSWSFQCTQDELVSIIKDTRNIFPAGRAVANLIRQQWNTVLKRSRKKKRRSAAI